MEKKDMMPEIKLNMPSSKMTLDPDTLAMTIPHTASKNAPTIDLFSAFSSIKVSVFIGTLALALQFDSHDRKRSKAVS